MGQDFEKKGVGLIMFRQTEGGRCDQWLSEALSGWLRAGKDLELF